MLKCTWLCIIIAIWFFARLILFLILQSILPPTVDWFAYTRGDMATVLPVIVGSELGINVDLWRWSIILWHDRDCEWTHSPHWPPLSAAEASPRVHTYRAERSKRRRCSWCHLGQSRGISCSLIDGDLLKDLSESEDDDGDETCIKRDLMFDVVASGVLC